MFKKEKINLEENQTKKTNGSLKTKIIYFNWVVKIGCKFGRL